MVAAGPLRMVQASPTKRKGCRLLTHAERT